MNLVSFLNILILRILIIEVKKSNLSVNQKNFPKNCRFLTEVRGLIGNFSLRGKFFGCSKIDNSILSSSIINYGVIDFAHIKISMIKRKQLRTHGKIRLSDYFQEFKKGDKVSVIRELALQPKFPKQIQGRTGAILDKRGKYYIVKINDLNKEKSYLIHPVHLRRLK